MRRTIILGLGITFVALAGFSQPSFADITCTLQDETKDSQIATVKGVKVGYHLTTPNDKSEVGNLCKRITDPLDIWRYGDYYPLYQSQPIKESGNQIEQYVSSRGGKQPALQRYICKDTNNANVGLYVTEWQPAPNSEANNIGTMVLHLACAGQSGQGTGIALLNKAAKDAFSKISGQNPNAENQSVSMKLVATKGAQTFYNRTSLTLQDEDTYQASFAYSNRANYSDGWFVFLRNTAAPQSYADCANIVYDKYYETDSYQTAIKLLGDAPWVKQARKCQNTKASTTNFNIWLAERAAEDPTLDDSPAWKQAFETLQTAQ